MNFKPKKTNSTLTTWTIASIRSAIDEQIKGRFALPVQLATAMRRDSELYSALINRIAPSRSLSYTLNAKNQHILKHAQLTHIRQPVISDIHADLANHGIAIAYITRNVNDKGDNTQFDLKTWPLEHVYWDTTSQSLMTQSESGDRLTINHGDGNWVVFHKHELDPWAKEAAIIPGGLLYGIHAFAIRDWASGSNSHGNAKPIGTLPEGTPLQVQDSDGNVSLSPEASAFLDLLSQIAENDSAYGIKPFGATIDYLANPSSQFMVWSELIAKTEASAARIYLGTDGTLGSKPNAPGTDITALFGVAKTIVDGDLHAIQSGINTGFWPIWAEETYGDPQLAPTMTYNIPDADLQGLADNFAQRNKAFYEDIVAAKSNGFYVDETYIANLAKVYQVPLPTIYDPDGDGEPGEPPTATAARELSDKMTQMKIERCEHGSKNRCRLCGIERVRDFTLDSDGNPIWIIKWQPIN